MKTTEKVVLTFAAVFVVAACAWAQTYQLKLEANGDRIGKPMSALTVVGAKGFGSSFGPLLYQAQPSTGVSVGIGSCGSNARLTVDASGNPYGQDVISGWGRIFAVKPGAKWIERDLYNFTGGDDGAVFKGDFYPSGAPLAESPVTFDASGNIWGMTYAGGPNTCNNSPQPSTCGVLFELIPNGDGTWSEQVIHAFSGPPDGAQPEGGLTLDPLTGNFYGTTQYGGDPVCNCGTVFQLSLNGDGNWTESVLYTFTDTAGLPNGGVILDAQGNLYGTNFGNSYVYEISGGQFSVLSHISGAVNGPLVLDSSGNLLGTTYSRGTFGLGTVFELSPSQNGWHETIIHSFAFTGQKPTDGKDPNSGLAMDAAGDLWGVTPAGGASLSGVFFEVTK